MIGKHGRVTGELAQRGHQPGQGVGTLQQIASAQGSDDALADLAVDALAADQLQVVVVAVVLDADEHGVVSVNSATTDHLAPGLAKQAINTHKRHCVALHTFTNGQKTAFLIAPEPMWLGEL
ncbi:MAG: hypothetical protein NTU53_05525 [Planctomycetota bacterium]|nr:hypothetical protein [Planctomycetota bacterium]